MFGGNIELVAASRLCKRSIKVLSREFGTNLIECNEHEGKELLLLYLGENHYNSARVKTAKGGGKTVSENSSRGVPSGTAVDELREELDGVRLVNDGPRDKSVSSLGTSSMSKGTKVKAD